MERGDPPLPRVDGGGGGGGGDDDEERAKREKFLAVFDFVVQGEGRLVKEGGGGGGDGAGGGAAAPAACLSPDVFADLMMMFSSWHPMREGGPGGDF